MSRSERRETFGALCVYGGVLLVAAPMVWLLWDVLGQGLPHLSPAYLSGAPLDAGRAGGIFPANTASANSATK